MAAPAAFKPETRQLSDAEVNLLNDMDAADGEELNLVRVFQPGDTVFDGSATRGDEDRFRVTFDAGSEQTTMVEIYDRDGRPMIMTLALAVVRLKKRDSLTGERIFYPRQMKQPPVGAFPCPSKWSRCKRQMPGSMLHTKQQQALHFEYKHQTEWRAVQAERKQEADERMIALQEAQVANGEAMTAILQRMSRGETVTPQEAQAAIQPAPVASDEPLDDLTDLSRDELKALADELGVDYPKKWLAINKGGWRAMIRAKRNGGNTDD